MEKLYSDVIYGRELPEILKPLLEGISEHHRGLSWALASRLNVELKDYSKINSMATDWWNSYDDRKVTGNVDFDLNLFSSLFEFKRAVENLFGGNLEKFALHFGESCKKFSNYELLNIIDRKMPRFEKSIRSKVGKHASSQRPCDLLMNPFQAFCKTVVAEGNSENIHLADLQGMEGWRIEFKTDIDEPTQRKWAKKVGITFKKGRRAKNN